MMMTSIAVELSDPVQALVDSRLDTIERMLMGRMPRQDRLAIVREVEAQVFELLQERGCEEFTREDVLAVLARLDPPEAYLPEVSRDVRSSEPSRRPSAPHAGHAMITRHSRVARASGILGLVSLALILLSPLGLGIAMAFQSEVAFIILSGGAASLSLLSCIIALVLSIYARFESAWAVVGIITSVLAMLLCFSAVIFVARGGL